MSDPRDWYLDRFRNSSEVTETTKENMFWIGLVTGFGFGFTIGVIATFYIFAQALGTQFK